MTTKWTDSSSIKNKSLASPLISLWDVDCIRSHKISYMVAKNFCKKK